MGWYGCDSPNSEKEKILSEYGASDKFKILGHKTTKFGKHFWVALEDMNQEQFIALWVFRGNRHDWAYKDITEHMGPAYCDCPVSLLDLTQAKAPKDKYAVEWRQEVRGINQKRITACKKDWTGQLVKIGDGLYKVLYKKKRSKNYIVECCDTGSNYRAKPEQFTPVENSTDFISKESA